MSAALASDAAPIQTNNAMNTRNGLLNTPIRPNATATNWPMPEAMCVAIA